MNMILLNLTMDTPLRWDIPVGAAFMSHQTDRLSHWSSSGEIQQFSVRMFVAMAVQFSPENNIVKLMYKFYFLSKNCKMYSNKP